MIRLIRSYQRTAKHLKELVGIDLFARGSLLGSQGGQAGSAPDFHPGSPGSTPDQANN